MNTAKPHHSPSQFGQSSPLHSAHSLNSNSNLLLLQQQQQQLQGALGGNQKKPNPALSQQQNEPEKQLRGAIESIMEAFDRKSHQAQEETSHWKQVASTQRQQMLSLETEIGHLTRRLSEYEQKLSTFQREKKLLASAKNALNEKYNFLRKSAMQLESFRKQIVSMVEFSPGAIQIPDPEASFIDVVPMNGTNGPSPTMHGAVEETTYVSAIPNMDAMMTMTGGGDDDGSFDFSQKHALFQQFKKDVTGSSNHSNTANNNNTNTNDDIGNDSFAITSTKDSNLLDLHAMQDDLESLSLTPFHPGTGLEKKSPKKKPMRVVDRQKIRKSAKSAETSFSQVGDISVDAPTLYKQVREVLTAAEFDQFASNIANFNAGNQSAAETVQNIGRLIKVDSLVAQMKALIHRAISESAQESVLANQGSADVTAL